MDKRGQDISPKTAKEILHEIQKLMEEFYQSSQNFIDIKTRQKRTRESRHKKSQSFPCRPNTYSTKDQGTTTSSLPCQGSCRCSCHITAESAQSLSPIDNLDKTDDVNSASANFEPPTQTEGQSPVSRPADESEVEHRLPTQDEQQETNTINDYCDEQTITYNQENDRVKIQNMDLMKENVDLKIMMQELNKLVNDKPQDEDSISGLHLSKIKDILSTVETVHCKSEILCDKLCDGLNNIKYKSGHTLSPELKEFCNMTKGTLGVEFRKIGEELGLDGELIKEIEEEYLDEEGCFHQIILEWSKKSEDPSYQELVAACHRINPKVLRCKPLSAEKVEVLEKCYADLCAEVIEAPLLPHLVSGGVMSFRLQRYVLNGKTSDVRISRLINIVSTKENGFDSLLQALDITYQHHVSSRLRDELGKTQSFLGDHTVEQLSPTATVPRVRPIQLPLPPVIRRRYGSMGSLDFDDDRTFASTPSALSCPANLDPQIILMKIYQMIGQACQIPR